MRAKEFITESSVVVQTIITQEMIDALHNNCSQYLNSGNDRPLFRGTRDYRDQQFVKMPIRTDRRPKDSSSMATSAFNYMFERATGIPQIRNITTYITPKLSTAMDYGDPFLVFPMNGTKYLKGHGINDLYSDLFDTGKIKRPREIAQEWAMAQKTDKDPLDLAQDAEYKFEEFHSRSDQGRLSADEMDQFFGPELVGAWHAYVAQFEPVMDNYRVYDGYDTDLNVGNEEIMLFGAPALYGIAILKIVDQLEEVEWARYTIYIGDEEMPIRTGLSDAVDLVMKSITTRQPLIVVKE